jgi:hypothetical protein
MVLGAAIAADFFLSVGFLSGQTDRVSENNR